MVPAGRFLVVSVEWDEDGRARQETYGPWAAASEDDSHLAAIGEFVRAWPERAGVMPKTVTLTLCTDPGAWLAGGRAGIEPASPLGHRTAVTAAVSSMAAGRPRSRG